jgi:hypothetical protein
MPTLTKKAGHILYSRNQGICRCDVEKGGIEMPFGYPYPYPYPGFYAGPYYGRSGAWTALWIVLFVLLLIFGGFWYFGGFYK